MTSRATSSRGLLISFAALFAFIIAYGNQAAAQENIAAPVAAGEEQQEELSSTDNDEEPEAHDETGDSPVENSADTTDGSSAEEAVLQEEAQPEEHMVEASEEETAPEPEQEEDTPPVSSGPPHCHGQSQSTWVIHDAIVMRMNSLGLANTVRGSYCWSIFPDREGILYALSNVEVGLLNHLAPVYAHFGAFASFTPISLLSFGVEISGFYVWPLSASNSGYIARDDYADHFESSGIIQHPAEDEEVEDTYGLNVIMNMTARGRISLATMRHGSLHLLISNTLSFEYWLDGYAPYYWNLKVDAILARSDWFLSNSAVVLLSFPLSDRHSLRVGVYDELLYALGWPGLERHQIGGILGINVSRLGRIRGFETVVILSGFTHLTSRTLRIPAINFMAKISIPIPLI